MAGAPKRDSGVLGHRDPFRSRPVVDLERRFARRVGVVGSFLPQPSRKAFRLSAEVHLPHQSRRLFVLSKHLAGETRRRWVGAALVAVPVAAILGGIDAAAGQELNLYATGFDSFAGPPTLTQGPFVVSWCLASAGVTASNFCPNGNALKLDATGDDPVLLIHIGDAPCAALTLSFQYGQFASSGTTLKAGFTSATSANCSIATPTILGTLSTTGGTCTTVTVTIPMAGETGVAFRFDHGANANALTIDSLSVAIEACCGSSHACCAPGLPGCDDQEVADCVCASDPYCCLVEWDGQCIDEIEALECGDCNGVSESCRSDFATDFGSSYATQSICVLAPQLFSSCEGMPPSLTISGACASTADPALRFATGFPHSGVVTRCLDFSAIPLPRLRFSYTRNAGTTGPRIDWRSEEGPWNVAWQPARGAGVGACTTVELNLEPIADLPAIQFRFTSASSVANGAAFDDIELIAAAEPHACCTGGGAGCADAAIEACVCAIDAYCCQTAWDEVCVEIATSDCNAGCAGIGTCGASDAGDCLTAHGTPFCAEAACCTAVCSIDSFCCAAEWDATCAEEAATLCHGSACQPALGSCLVPRTSAGCGDPDCCAIVCIVDPICCLAAWDALCALEAEGVCAPASADLDGNGLVGPADLAILLSSWGSTGAADLDGSGLVDAADLAMLLASWTL